ncbi:radical SAM protein [Photorhabdus laumondii]|uniref:radical SAM protein n=1 Tax=Photorhabdus laumondii TaxID=2218628 RepID=UPI000692193B
MTRMAHPTVLETLLHNNPELNIPVHEYNINVTSNHGDILSDVDTFQAYKDFDGAGKETHLYLHLPLCDYICHYCNYVKRRIKANDKMHELEIWADLLIQESNLYLTQVPWVRQAQIKSFYIGGGTGALLLNNPVAITKLMTYIRENYQLADDCEISLEGNPENYLPQHVELALSLGFNRFSIGIQSLQNEVNDFTNRRHTKEDALNAIHVLKQTGKPFSTDMMFGLPYQTIDTVTQDIRTLVEIEVPAITIYRLRNSDRESMGIGNASVWNADRQKEKLDAQHLLPDVIDTYKMRDAITKILWANDYHPSPCGWWNKKGTYKDGNIPRVSKDKWEKYNTMIALGPGAYGWLSGGNDTIIQTHNQTNINLYMTYMQSNPTAPPLAFGRVLEGNVAIGTKLAFAYKANQPIRVQDYQTQFGVHILKEAPYKQVFDTLIQKDLITLSEDQSYLLPTWKGEELHEEVMYVYFHQMIGGADQILCRRVSSA